MTPISSLTPGSTLENVAFLNRSHSGRSPARGRRRALLRSKSSRQPHRTSAIQSSRRHRPSADIAPRNPVTSKGRHELLRGHGFWSLTFEGNVAVLKHEQGLNYIAWLLAHPNHAPIHALDLVTRLSDAAASPGALSELKDHATGTPVILDKAARIQELSFGLDAARTMRKTLRDQERLEALLEDPMTSEPVRAEVERELIELYAYEKKHSWKVRDSAARAADSVGHALSRLYRHLSGACHADGTPHYILRDFAEHIRVCILVPSGRAGGHGGYRARSGIAGCFQYRPSKGTRWQLI